jgi:hypothetical protein
MVIATLFEVAKLYTQPNIINRWTDRENVVHRHKECYSATRREILSFVTTWMSPEDKDTYCISSLILESYKAKPMRAESSMVVTRGCGGRGGGGKCLTENRETLVKVCKVQQDRKDKF